jgi:TM2 domain-containing membrane protein YozV
MKTRNLNNERRYCMSKDPTLACLLNLILLGTGHMYLGQVAKGVLILALGLAVAMVVWPATALVIVWAMYDAYKTAKKMNRSIKTTVAEKMK